jgi:RNA polymerase sigma factor (sigma-70 family)
MKRMPTASHTAPLAGLALRCQPDARLVLLCREGRDRAFEEIVRRYRPQLVSFAGAIVPAHRAEDVVQEALTSAHSSLAASHGEMKLKPWLHTIVRNRALNDLRDEPVHQHLDDDFDGVPQPPEVAAQRAELSAVLARVKSLPGAQREALVRRELEGRNHQEIAAAIGVSPGAVRGLIFRARTALREAAGLLVPLPVVRALLSAGPLTTETAGAGVGVGGAAAGLTAGGGGAIAIKASAALLVAGLVVGSGVTLHDHGDSREATAATVAQSGDSAAPRGEVNSRHSVGNDPGQRGRSEAGQSDRGPGSGDNSNIERSSSAASGGRDVAGEHHDSSGDDGPSPHMDEGSDDSQHGGPTSGEDEGGDATSGGGSGDGPSDELGGSDSSDDGASNSGDGGASGDEGATSHEGTDHATADAETASEH